MSTLSNCVARLLPPACRAHLHHVALLVLRLSYGTFMIYGHGWGKLMSFAEKAGQFPDPLGIGSSLSMGLAIFAEAGCSLLLALGLLTRVAAFNLAFTMSVAAFVVHRGAPFKTRELALVYLAVYVTLLLAGPGRFSLDQLLFGRSDGAQPDDNNSA